MKKKNELLDTIFSQTFLGQEVELLMNLTQKLVEETPNGTMIQEAPLATRGFLLDIDEDYLYLGNTPGEITKALRRENIVGIEMVSYTNEFDEVLDRLPTEGNGN